MQKTTKKPSATARPIRKPGPRATDSEWFGYYHLLEESNDRLTKVGILLI